MKKLIQSLCLLLMALGTVVSNAQNRPAISAETFQTTVAKNLPVISDFTNPGHNERSVTCPNDTVAFSLNKNLVNTVKGFGYEFESGSYYGGGGQYFDAPQQMTVHGFNIYGRTIATGVTTNVTASIYLAGPDSLPIGSPLSTTSVNLDYQTTFGPMKKTANFSAPVTVNGPYVLTVENTTATVVQLFNNFWGVTGDTLSGRGEQLNLIYYYLYGWEKAKDWNPNYDYDYAFEPIVSYNLISDFTPSTLQPCEGDNLTFVNNSSTILNSRYYNLAVFLNYYDGTNYDYYEWDLDDGSAIIENQGASINHSYLTSGSYDVSLFSILYRWGTAICFDEKITTITVNPLVPPDVSIAITNGSNPTCPGAEVTFTATPVNGGTAPTYQWFINGNPVSGATGVTYTDDTFTDGDLVTVEITSNADCISSPTATSTAIEMDIDPLLTLTPAVTVTPSANPFCPGSSVTFTATPTNGGSAATYVWYVNGIVDGSSTSSTFTVGSLVDGDEVEVEMTSSLACADPTTANSTPVTMDEEPVLTPAVSISAGVFCTGGSVTITATPTNGGANPTYVWYVNSNIDGSSTTDVFTASLADGDVVSVVMTSTGCVNPTTATSTPITLTSVPSVTPSVSIAVTGNPFCPGGNVTVTATPTNGGTAPNYQWLVNGIPVFSGPTNTFTGPGQDGVSVTVAMTSDAPCASPATVTSTGVTLTEIIGPSASFSSIETNPGVVAFTNNSIGSGALTFSWDFDDGTTSIDQDPIHTYTANGTYTVGLTVTDACGSTVVTTQTVTITGLSINRNTGNSNISVYPNPSNGVFNVKLNAGEDATVVVYNTLGSVITETASKGNSRVTLDLTNQAKGIYFVKVSTDSETVVAKINIIK